MAYIDVAAFKKLRAFLWGLQKSGFNLERIPFKDDQGMPIDKESSLKLLHSLPDFQKEEFKDDNAIIQYLKKRSNFNQTLDQFTREQQNELTKALEEEPATAGREPVGHEGVPAGQETQPMGASGGSAGGMPGMGMPSAPSISSGPRRIFDAEQTTPPGGKEGGTGTGTAATNKINRLEAEKAEIKTPQAKETIRSTPSPRRLNSSGFRSRLSNLSGKIQNFTSPGGPFIKTNLNGIGNGLKNMFGQTASLGGRAGLGAINHAGDSLSNLSRSKSKLADNLNGAKSRASSIGEAKKVSLVLGIIFMVVFMGELGGAISNTSTGEAAVLPPGTPGATNISTCKFTRANNPQLIKSSTLVGWISNAASSTGIAPQVLASIAMHENQDFVANADNNHDAVKTNQFCNKGLIFCEKSGQVLHNKPGEDDPCTADEITSGARNAQAVGLMQLLDIYNPGKDLCSITENLNIAATKLKADGINLQPTKDQVDAAIKSYYNSCIYGSYNYCNEVWQDVQNCQQAVPPYQPGDGSGIISCPLIGGYMTTGSKDAPGGQGHCSADYQKDYPCAVPDVTGRATAVDLESSSKNVYLPYVNNEKVTWRIVEPNTAINENEGGGVAVAATTSSQGKTYTARFVHLASSNLKANDTLNSADLIGQYLTHLHVTLQENGDFKPGDRYFNLCK